MRISNLLLSFALLLIAPAAWADICEDINDLSNNWNDIADALEQTAGEEVGDLDASRLERDVNALLPETEDLGDYLIDVGTRDEAKIGRNLLDLVDDLIDTDGDDLAAYLVDRIDDLVTCLDFTVDYCDAVNE